MQLRRHTFATLGLIASASCASTQATAPSQLSAPKPAHGHGHHHGEHGMPHRFEHAEEWTKVFDDPARDAWQRPREIVAAMRIDPGMTIADIGAGTGYFLPYLSEAAGPSGTVLGLDVEPDMVRFMRDRAQRSHLDNVRSQQVRPHDPSLSQGSVHRILIVDTWHHLADRETYARKLRDSLAPNGQLFIVDFTKDSPEGPPPSHRLSPAQVIEELTASGLRAESVAVPLPNQYVVRGRLPER